MRLAASSASTMSRCAEATALAHPATTTMHFAHTPFPLTFPPYATMTRQRWDDTMSTMRTHVHTCPYPPCDDNALSPPHCHPHLPFILPMTTTTQCRALTLVTTTTRRAVNASSSIATATRSNPHPRHDDNVTMLSPRPHSRSHSHPPSRTILHGGWAGHALAGTNEVSAMAQQLGTASAVACSESL